MRKLLEAAEQVAQKAMRDRVAPVDYPDAVWTTRDGGYPAELMALLDAIEEARAKSDEEFVPV
jgi:hypothetical protein